MRANLHPTLDDLEAVMAHDDGDEQLIERAVLNDSAEGQVLATRLIELFGAFMSEEVRPVLRRISEEGGEPQLTVNALAELLRQIADATEKPVER
ncbi:hypothetical protein [Rhabdothermincola salaria]|uniref:hypothetical protein n=1 Tax=Rhabdothermincola salaria TaxID=2903142 RepID=UPI001E54EB98|nr:hypothetical protein [Rhabdothermincola salaria]MCD9622400.1 hypothetical protein [Rhabdothermincola salaria]